MAAQKGKGGAQSKYTPELVKEICDDIAVHGTYRSGWDGRVVESTFHRWLVEKQEFSELVKQAKKEYSDTLPISRYRQANKAFNDYLHGTMERVIVTTRSGVSPDGSWQQEEVKRIPVGIPKWAIERIIGTQTTEEEAIKKFAEAGWISKEIMKLAIAELHRAREAIRELFKGVLPVGIEQSKPGLTDETAAAIRSRILGIESSSIAALPTEMDSGSELDQDLREESADRHIVG